MTAVTTPTPTAPLPTLAVDAASRLAQAAAVYEATAVQRALLAERAESGTLSDLDADSLAHAEELMVGMWVKLARAGRLDLIGGAA